MSFTRKQMMDKECTHDEYYAQYVNAAVLLLVGDTSSDARLSVYNYFSEIIRSSLLYSPLVEELGETRTLAVGVCIAKAAVRYRDNLQMELE